jgi:hypothetical protein
MDNSCRVSYAARDFLVASRCVAVEGVSTVGTLLSLCIVNQGKPCLLLLQSPGELFASKASQSDFRAS